MTEKLLKLRNSTNDLKNRRIVPSSTLGILEGEIGWALMACNKTDEARDLLNQAVSDLKQSLAKNPEDKEARLWLLRSLVLVRPLAEGAGQLEDALNCFEQAAAIHMDFEPSDSAVTVLTSSTKACNVSPIDSDRAVERERRNVRNVEPADPQTPLLIGHRKLDGRVLPWGWRHSASCFRRHRSQENVFHEDKGSSPCHMSSFVAEWIAISVGPLSPFRSSSVAAMYDRDPEAGALALISAIRDRCSKLGLAESMVPSDDQHHRMKARSGVASEQRRLGRSRDARATAARLMVFARRLVQEYPNSAYCYRVLSDAHDQIKKNAFESRDDNLIEEALVHAIAAAQRSLALDPTGRHTTPSGQAHRTAREHQSRSERDQALAAVMINSPACQAREPGGLEMSQIDVEEPVHLHPAGHTRMVYEPVDMSVSASPSRKSATMCGAL